MPIWIIPAILAFICGVSFIIVTLVTISKEKTQEVVEQVERMDQNVAAGFRARSTSPRAPFPFQSAAR